MSRTDWHRCVVFGRLAQAAAALKKGDYVNVQGQIQTREYNGGKDSEKHRITEVRVASLLKVERLTKDDDSQSGERDEV
jgi:single-strand DNA-binding protein